MEVVVEVDELGRELEGGGPESNRMRLCSVVRSFSLPSSLALAKSILVSTIKHGPDNARENPTSSLMV